MSYFRIYFIEQKNAVVNTIIQQLKAIEINAIQVENKLTGKKIYENNYLYCIS